MMANTTAHSSMLTTMQYADAHDTTWPTHHNAELAFVLADKAQVNLQVGTPSNALYQYGLSAWGE